MLVPERGGTFVSLTSGFVRPGEAGAFSAREPAPTAELRMKTPVTTSSSRFRMAYRQGCTEPGRSPGAGQTLPLARFVGAGVRRGAHRSGLAVVVHRRVVRRVADVHRGRSRQEG